MLAKCFEMLSECFPNALKCFPNASKGRSTEHRNCQKPRSTEHNVSLSWRICPLHTPRVYIRNIFPKALLLQTLLLFEPIIVILLAICFQKLSKCFQKNSKRPVVAKTTEHNQNRYFFNNGAYTDFFQRIFPKSWFQAKCFRNASKMLSKMLPNAMKMLSKCF